MVLDLLLVLGGKIRVRRRTSERDERPDGHEDHHPGTGDAGEGDRRGERGPGELADRRAGAAADLRGPQ